MVRFAVALDRTQICGKQRRLKRCRIVQSRQLSTNTAQTGDALENRKIALQLHLVLNVLKFSCFSF
jgi:hypothetical protein